MLKLVLTGALAGALLAATPYVAKAAGEAEPLLHRSWSFNGVFGTYDDAAKQRGMQVFQNACQACHGLEYVAFRTLTDLGYSEDEVRAIAAQYTILDGPDDTGEMFERPGIPADKWPSPYRNKEEAAYIHGKAPPDLSLITKARGGGADYVYSLMLGYDEDQETDNGYWNAFYPGHIIAMPPQLYEDLVEYQDGTLATPEQMAADVSHFLMWAAEPKLEERKSIGLTFMIFCTVMMLVFYGMKRRIWKNVH